MWGSSCSDFASVLGRLCPWAQGAFLPFLSDSSSTETVLSLRGHLAISGGIFNYHNWAVLSATGEQRPEMLLTVIQ